MGAQAAPLVMIVIFLPFVVAFSVYAIYHEVMEHPKALSVTKSVLAGIGCLILVILSFAGVDYFRRRISGVTQYTFGNMASHYLCLIRLQFTGRRMRNKLESDTIELRNVQNRLIMQRVRRNQSTIYGRDYNFKSIKTMEDFLKKHPLTRYNHYQSYLEKIVEGQENVLNVDNTVLLAITSGASGHSNMLPLLSHEKTLHYKFGYAVVWRILHDNFSELKRLRKILRFAYTPRTKTISCGIPVGQQQPNVEYTLQMLSTPTKAFKITDDYSLLYIHLLFGLRDPNIGLIESGFASVLYTAMKALRNHWRDLVNDIETGTINFDIKLTSNLRKHLESLLTPDIDRASFLREEFDKGFDGIVSRIWPDLQCVLTVDSGSNDIYGRILKQHEFQGIIFYSALYSATEGLLGINLDPLSHNRHYLLIPRTVFYEFIPLEQSDEEQPSTILLDEVEDGKDYELVISNQSGLYRYRFGDVVRVVGFHNHCPMIEFLYRQGQFLNVRGEKTSEKAFYSALLHSARNWHGMKLIDYCCVESAVLEQVTTKNEYIDLPFYAVFLELENSHLICPSQLDEIDKTLCKEFFVYETFRKKNSIAPMKVYVVKPGTFADFRQFLRDTADISLNLYKTPRVLRRPDAVQFMLDHIDVRMHSL